MHAAGIFCNPGFPGLRGSNETKEGKNNQHQEGRAHLFLLTKVRQGESEAGLPVVVFANFQVGGSSASGANSKQTFIVFATDEGTLWA